MKNVILVASLFLSATALANEACDKFIPCGTFEGSGQNYDVSSNKVGARYLEKMVITPNGNNSADIEVFVYHKGQTPGEKGTYDLKLTFDFSPTGLATTKRDIMAGYCLSGVCALSFIPWEHPPGKTMTANVNILRFEDGVLTRQMMASVSGTKTDFQRSRLVKK